MIDVSFQKYVDWVICLNRLCSWTSSPVWSFLIEKPVRIHLVTHWELQLLELGASSDRGRESKRKLMHTATVFAVNHSSYCRWWMCDCYFSPCRLSWRTSAALAHNFDRSCKRSNNARNDEGVSSESPASESVLVSRWSTEASSDRSDQYDDEHKPSDCTRDLRCSSAHNEIRGRKQLWPCTCMRAAPVSTPTI